MNDDRPIRIDAAQRDVVEEHSERGPEPGALHRAFGLERDRGAARIVSGRVAVLGRKVGGETAEISGVQFHERHQSKTG